MTNNRHTYRHIQRALMQLYPRHALNGHQIRHLNTLAAMIFGIIQGKSCQMEKMARKIPGPVQVESRTRRFSRVIQHKEVKPEIYFLPFIMPLLQSLANRGTLILAIDGSETGRKCMTLMISVIYRKRAIPIAWLVVKGSKGHLAADSHLDLIAQVSQIISYDCQVIVLGDGEFDGTRVQEALSNLGWHYVLRTAKNAIVNDDGDEFSLQDISLARGQLIEIPGVALTREYYGPVTVILWWHRDYDKPICLVTNMACSEEACYFYRKRFRIETFFSDQKSRGFNLHKSHQSNPERLSRLLIAACLAYIWMIYLGTLVQNDSRVMKQIHRADRCDLSLFQIGLRYWEFLLNREASIPFSFLLPVS